MGGCVKVVYFNDRVGREDIGLNVRYYILTHESYSILLNFEDLILMFSECEDSVRKINCMKGAHTLKINEDPEIDVISLENFMRLMDELYNEENVNKYVERAWSLHENIIYDLIKREEEL